MVDVRNRESNVGRQNRMQREGNEVGEVSRSEFLWPV